MDFAQAAGKWLAEIADPETKWKRMSGVLKHWEGLRRRDHWGMRIDLEHRKEAAKSAVSEQEVRRMIERETGNCEKGDPS